MKVKALFFDCDGVLMFGAPWLKLHKTMGISSELDLKWFQEYYAGKISFGQWTDNVANYYKKNKLDRKIFEEVMDLKNYTFNNEAYKLIKFLYKNNIEIAIVSSGIDFYVENVAKHFGIKYCRANARFLFDENGMFQKILYGIDDMQQKVLDLDELCKIMSIKPSESIFIGDSDNDLKAFAHTKRGILYKNDLPELQDKAWKKVENLEDVIDIIKEVNEQ